MMLASFLWEDKKISLSIELAQVVCICAVPYMLPYYVFVSCYYCAISKIT